VDNFVGNLPGQTPNAALAGLSDGLLSLGAISPSLRKLNQIKHLEKCKEKSMLRRNSLTLIWRKPRFWG
jgi:hypothetical protein